MLNYNENIEYTKTCLAGLRFIKWFSQEKIKIIGFF
jgi:hypothetical protein